MSGADPFVGSSLPNEVIVGTVQARRSLDKKSDFTLLIVDVSIDGETLQAEVVVAEKDYIALVGKRYKFTKTKYTDPLIDVPIYSFELLPAKPKRFGLW